MTARPAGRALLAAGAVLALAVTSGCSSAGPAPGRSGGSAVPSPTSSPAPSSTNPAPAAATSVVPSATATPTSAPRTREAPTVAGPPAPGALRSTCPSLTIRVIRGSAAPGYEFAALQFVNTASTQCVLNGYPTVTLLRAGVQVGRPSSPAGSATSRFVLAPGATAESLLRDYSSCNAPLSDQIRVVAPGSSLRTTRPGQLRACTLRVSALATPE